MFANSNKELFYCKSEIINSPDELKENYIYQLSTLKSNNFVIKIQLLLDFNFENTDVFSIAEKIKFFMNNEFEIHYFKPIFSTIENDNCVIYVETDINEKFTDPPMDYKFIFEPFLNQELDKLHIKLISCSEIPLTKKVLFG